MEKLKELFGETLLTKSGLLATEKVLETKSRIGIYFSAHWCGPCRAFTPVLSSMYSELKDSGEHGLEIVFVSLDRDQDAFNEYYADMGWAAIPFDKLDDFKETLSDKYDCQGIPQFTIIDSDGSLITNDGTQLISKFGVKAFPYTPEHIKSLSVLIEKEANAAVNTLFSEHSLNLFGNTLDGKVQYACLVLGNPRQDRAVSALSSILPIIAKNDVGMVVRYIAWEDPANQDHKKVAGDIIIIPSTEISDKLRDVITKSVCNEISVPQLALYSKDGDGLWMLSCGDIWQHVSKFRELAFPWTDQAVQKAEEAARNRLDKLRQALPGLALLKTEGRSTLQRGAGAAAKPEEVDAVAGQHELVGLYFSASWCGPCRNFTPKLASAYQELRAAGKGFEVVFVSSDQSQEDFDDYFGHMPWLALPFHDRNLKQDLSELFEVRGIPTLVLLRPRTGEVAVQNGREAIEYGADFWPFDADSLKRGAEVAKERELQREQAALEAERTAVALQEAAAGPKAVVRRWRGPPGSALLDPAQRTLSFSAFTTVAAPNCLIPAGARAYYEIELTECESIAQVGWATKGLAEVHERTGEGVGDEIGSWGADGVRQLKWCGPKTGKFGSAWKAGDVIGLAVWSPGAGDPAGDPAGEGGTWVSVNGSFAEPDGRFADGAELAAGGAGGGLFPALTGSPGFSFKYNFGQEAFKHPPPSADYRPVLSFAPA